MGKTEKNLIKRLSKLEGEESLGETMGTFALGIATFLIYGYLIATIPEPTYDQYREMMNSQDSTYHENQYSEQN